MKDNYRISHDGLIVIKMSTSDNPKGYPINDTMPEWIVYQEWIAAGNEPEMIPPPTQPVPAVISRRQFYQQAAKVGIITKNEAKQVIKSGTLPTVLQNIVDGITDPEEQFDVEMLLTAAISFERNHPMTAAIGSSLGLTDQQIDEFFIAASQI